MALICDVKLTLVKECLSDVGSRDLLAQGTVRVQGSVGVDENVTIHC